MKTCHGKHAYNIYSSFSLRSYERLIVQLLIVNLIDYIYMHKRVNVHIPSFLVEVLTPLPLAMTREIGMGCWRLLRGSHFGLIQSHASAKSN